jgi:ubiquinone/menaquinone biosynthesis C-methylase UbiE
VAHVATAAAVDWWAQARQDAGAWVDTYKNSLHQPHRTAIARIMQHYQPASLIEVGCHCGPNLIRLAQDVPSLTDLFGIDANAQAIDAGQAWAAEAGLAGRVQMRQGRFPADTSSMGDRCADVVLSCYALAYLAPEDLDAALYEMGRLAAKVVILAEPLSPTTPVALHRAATGYQEWAHAYGRALKWIGTFAGTQVRVVDVEPPVDRLNAIVVLERP